MITNFVIHDGALRSRVARVRAPFLVLAAAPRDLPRHPARLICRWTIDPATGALSANWTEAAVAPEASQDYKQDIARGRKRSRTSLPPWFALEHSSESQAA
jgi:hypothetical protein